MPVHDTPEFQLNIQKLKTNQLKSLNYSFSFMTKILKDGLLERKCSLVALNNPEGSPNVAHNTQFIAF